MSTIIQHVGEQSTGYKYRLHIRGASEYLLAICTHYIDVNGNRQEFTEEIRSQFITDSVDTYARDAMRTLGFAYKDLTEADEKLTQSEADEGLVDELEKDGLTFI